MAMATINVRINEEDKKQFDSLCNELGMNMSTAFNIFIKTMLREQGLPFEITTKKLNKETLLAMEEAKRIASDTNVKSYKNAKEAFTDILGEDY